METEFWSLALKLTLIVCVLAALLAQHNRRRRRELEQLPPGPKGWPIIGNIVQLGWAPHQSLALLARKHGPIMTLHLGSMRTVVISSEAVARDVFKNNDAALAGRVIYEVMKGSYGNEGSLITAQYGPHWRLLKRLCMTEFFNPSKIDAMNDVRAKCVDRLVNYIESVQKSNAIDIRRFFFLMSFNLIGNLMLSRDFLDTNSKVGAKFFQHAEKIMELAGKPNVADFLPLLRWVDPQGIRRKMEYHLRTVYEMVGGFISERIESSERMERRDFLDVLLGFEGDGVEEPMKFSSKSINVTILEMFIAGTDTTTSTLEWAMAELLRNPKDLMKVQAEIRGVVGPNGKLEERHIAELPCVKAVIKETLRLHPPLPFLVPHKAMSSCKIQGYCIPKETQVLVNAWAIGREPKSWKEPLDFKPERFMELNHIDYKGQHFNYIPFGSGRRRCPAVSLASCMLPLALGSLLHSFDWVLADGGKPEEMDMREHMGISLKKKVPLRVMATPYKG